MSARLITRAPELRLMRAADLSTVAGMERAAYEYPWTEGIFRDCLRVGYHCLVLEGDGGSVQGYAIMSVAADEAHLLNLCIRSDRRRCGLGRDLLRQLLADAGWRVPAACSSRFVRPMGRLLPFMLPRDLSKSGVGRAITGQKRVGKRRWSWRAIWTMHETAVRPAVM